MNARGLRVRVDGEVEIEGREAKRDDEAWCVPDVRFYTGRDGRWTREKQIRRVGIDRKRTSMNYSQIQKYSMKYSD